MFCPYLDMIMDPVWCAGEGQERGKDWGEGGGGRIGGKGGGEGRGEKGKWEAKGEEGKRELKRKKINNKSQCMGPVLQVYKP